MDSGEGDQSNQREVPGWDKKLAKRFFRHLQREVHEKPVDDGKVLLLDLFDMSHANFIEHTQEYSFDNFMRFLGTDCVLHLQEKCQDHRFLGVLIREIQCGFAAASLQCSAQQWTALVVIIEVLEEQDLHLVVNTLEKQLPQLQLTSSDLGERWRYWLRILCLRLMQEDRVQVQRKALKYFLNHLSVDQLCRLSLLPEFLGATSRTQLFDPEDENCLKDEELEKFVANGNVELLLEALVAVSWENVPLLLWIRCLKAEQMDSVPKELFIKLCLFVGAIDNYGYRKGVRDRVMLIFKTTLDGFSLRDFMMCMKSMFHKGDPYSDHDRLLDKTSKCSDFEELMDCLNHKSLEIFNYNHWSCGNLAAKLFNILISKMETLPKYKYCFLRLLLFINHFNVSEDFYRKVYNVDTSLLQAGASLEEMQVHLLEKLECQTSEEISFLKARCVDLFTYNLRSWSQLEELNLDPLELIDQGTDDTINNLLCLSGEPDNGVKNEKLLSTLIDYNTQFLKYAYKKLTEEEFENCLNNLLLKKRPFTLGYIEVSISMYLKLLLYGEPTRGLARIEAFYAFKLLDADDPNVQIRDMTIMALNIDETGETKSKIFKELLRINGELSIEHPHYTENSEVHRKKMRIASALIEMCDNCDDPESLKTLFLPSDQLGISLMHEFLVGKCVKNIDWVLKALPNLEPSQQESYLSIAHIFIFNNLVKLNEENKLSEMFSLLLPFTMVSCYETRTLAQLILHRLALECELNSIHLPIAEIVINSVETSLGKTLCELQSEPRLILAEILLHVKLNISHFILNMTNVPFDERQKCYDYSFMLNKIKIARQAFRVRKLLSSAQFAPSNNINEENYFKKYYDVSYRQMGLMVVASLFDKKSNFERFVVICQRFGVDFLVVGEESHLEECDIGTLRIRKENIGSLAGFLQTKQTEGYKLLSCTKQSQVISILKKLQIFHFGDGRLLFIGNIEEKPME